MKYVSRRQISSARYRYHRERNVCIMKMKTMILLSILLFLSPFCQHELCLVIAESSSSSGTMNATMISTLSPTPTASSTSNTNGDASSETNHNNNTKRPSSTKEANRRIPPDEKTQSNFFVLNEQLLDLVMQRLRSSIQNYITCLDRIEQLHNILSYSSDMKVYDIISIIQYVYTETLLYREERNDGFQLYLYLEDGTSYNINPSLTSFYYHEPGYSGYELVNVTTTSTTSSSSATKKPKNSVYQSYYESCIDAHGQSIPCIMEYNMSYVECNNQCELIPCDSIEDPNTISSKMTQSQSQQQKQKWCRSYTVKNVTKQQHYDQSLGYIPRIAYCLNSYGIREERPGYVLMPDRNTSTVTTPTNATLGNCYYADGYTMVNNSNQRYGRFSMCGDSNFIPPPNSNDDKTNSSSSNNIQTCPDTVGNTNHIIIKKQQSSYRYLLNNHRDTQANDTQGAAAMNDNKRIYPYPSCNTAMYGRYSTDSFDHRFRDWYQTYRVEQKSSWHAPFLVWGRNVFSLQYNIPLYDIITTVQEDKDNINGDNDESITKPKVNDLLFIGLLSGGFYLRTINEAMKKQYSNMDAIVFVVEVDEPHHYMIATSISSSLPHMMGVVQSILLSDTSQLCPPEQTFNASYCTSKRVSVYNYVNSTNPYENLVYKAFIKHEKEEFQSKQVYVNQDTNNIKSKVYISRYDRFVADGILWYVFVLIPMPRSNRDAIYWNNPNESTTQQKSRLMFGFIVVLASLGVIGCMILFVLFYRKRKEKAIIYSDYRFTSIFLFQCSMLNISSYTLLGMNSKVTCLLRMWSFNLIFVSAVSPLFVKVWRMAKLLNASAGFQRTKITNFLAFMYTLPMIIVEIIILTTISIIDPPLPTEEVGVNQDIDGIGVHEIVCAFDTKSFAIIQGTYSGFLVVLGCILAYRTKDLDPKFGEAKQLAFAMYNIACTAILLFSVISFLNFDQVGVLLFQATGVLYATLTCCLAFVLPRLLQLQKEVAKRKSRETRQQQLLQQVKQQRQDQVQSHTQTPTREFSVTEANDPNNTNRSPRERFSSAVILLTNVIKLTKHRPHPPPLINESLVASRISGWDSSTAPRIQLGSESVAVSGWEPTSDAPPTSSQHENEGTNNDHNQAVTAGYAASNEKVMEHNFSHDSDIDTDSGTEQVIIANSPSNDELREHDIAFDSSAHIDHEAVTIGYAASNEEVMEHNFSHDIDNSNGQVSTAHSSSNDAVREQDNPCDRNIDIDGGIEEQNMFEEQKEPSTSSLFHRTAKLISDTVETVLETKDVGTDNPSTSSNSENDNVVDE